MRNYLDYLRVNKLPHSWCSGCGCGMVLQAILRSLAEQNLDPTQVVVVTGAGCSSQSTDAFMNTNCLHVDHGRALAAATGVKLANPDLHVIAVMGDGDAVTIGGNHFIHGCRRNIDVTAIVINNLNYGMTGGQYSSTTDMGANTTTSRYGHIEDAFDVCALANASGAKYVARALCDDVRVLQKLITEGMKKKGMAVIDAISYCPTHYGRNNGMRTVVEMMKHTREATVTIAKAAQMSKEELRGKFVVGKFVDIDDCMDYGSKYAKIIDDLQKGDQE